MPNSDEQALWRELFDRHAPGLILLARQWCPAHADAEDAVQEAFVRFWRSHTQADDPAAYLFTCVKHAALDHVRGESRRHRREETAAQRQPSRNESLFEAGADQQDRAALIEHHLATLPHEQREVLVMKVWGGLTFQQIAVALDASPNTIASRYRYALEALRRSLPQEHAA